MFFDLVINACALKNTNMSYSKIASARGYDGKYTFKSKVKQFFQTVWYWTKVGTGTATLIVVAASVGWMIRGNEVSAQVNFISTSTTTTTVIHQDSEILDAVGDCESGVRKSNNSAVKGSRRQFLPNGNVVTNTNNNGTVDIGMYGINMSASAIIEMAKLHIDPMTEEGNRAYAKHLHDKNGMSDWRASQTCWIQSL